MEWDCNHFVHGAVKTVALNNLWISAENRNRCAICHEQCSAPTLTSPKVLWITAPRHNTQTAPYSWTARYFLYCTVMKSLSVHHPNCNVSAGWNAKYVILGLSNVFFKRDFDRWQRCTWEKFCSVIFLRAVNNSPTCFLTLGLASLIFLHQSYIVGRKNRTLLSFAFLLLFIHHVYSRYFFLLVVIQKWK